MHTNNLLVSSVIEVSVIINFLQTKRLHLQHEPVLIQFKLKTYTSLQSIILKVLPLNVLEGGA